MATPSIVDAQVESFELHLRSISVRILRARSPPTRQLRGSASSLLRCGHFGREIERTKFRPSPLRGLKDAIARYPSLLNHERGLARKVILDVSRKVHLHWG
jgi:hypothetical protein